MNTNTRRLSTLAISSARKNSTISGLRGWRNRKSSNEGCPGQTGVTGRRTAVRRMVSPEQDPHPRSGLAYPLPTPKGPFSPPLTRGVAASRFLPVFRTFKIALRFVKQRRDGLFFRRRGVMNERQS